MCIYMFCTAMSEFAAGISCVRYRILDKTYFWSWLLHTIYTLYTIVRFDPVLVCERLFIHILYINVPGRVLCALKQKTFWETGLTAHRREWQREDIARRLHKKFTFAAARELLACGQRLISIFGSAFLCVHNSSSHTIMNTQTHGHGLRFIWIHN